MCPVAIGADVKMSPYLCNFCTHTGLIGPGELPGDGEMSEMTLLSDTRFKIQTLEV